MSLHVPRNRAKLIKLLILLDIVRIPIIHDKGGALHYLKMLDTDAGYKAVYI